MFCKLLLQLQPEVIFGLKMHKKAFGDRAPPGPEWKLAVLPRPSSCRERKGRERTRGSFWICYL